MKNKTFEHIKKVCGGGEEADFEKNKTTKEEISKCVERLGCVSLEDIAYHRRKMKKHGLKYG